jgi:hypothetical protein
MAGLRTEPVVRISIGSRLRAWSMQGPESDASTLATSTCPAGPEDEPGQRSLLSGSGPRWRESRRLAIGRTAVERGSLVVPCCLEEPRAVSGVLVPAATYNHRSGYLALRAAFLRSIRLKQLQAMWHHRGGVATNRHKR